MRRFARFTLWMIALGCLLVAAATAGAVYLYQDAKGDKAWPHVTDLKSERIGQNSEIYSTDNKRIGVIASEENRRIVKLDRMGEWAPKALVAIEDRRFFEHDGVDRQGIIRAAWVNVRGGGVSQGASTIDQQLVRNLYAEIDQDKTLTRKMKEASLAQELNRLWEKQYGSKRKAKEQILESYLNTVFFGSNAYGIEAASQTYFAKPAAKLEPHEAALLVGLVQNPTTYNPFEAPDKAEARRNEVLDAMCDVGDIDDCASEKAKPLGVERGKLFVRRGNPYVFDYVQREVAAAYGKQVVKQGGLKITTSIDPKMQLITRDAMNEVLNQEGDPIAAMVVIENKTGYVRAMTSSAAYRKTQFNFAADARRQPGSSAKTWALATMLLAGVDPDQTKYLSTPLAIELPGGAGLWKPSTYAGTYAGLTSVSEATILSDNSVYAQMTLDMSPKRVASTARRLGIKTKLQAVPSIGLGSQGVTPLEQTNLYATIARGGQHIEPRILRVVESTSGAQRDVARAQVRPALHGNQAAVITKILEANVQRGTGTAAQIPGVPVAGKTGTTDDYKDAWFCGYTPIYTSCVWVGYPKPREMTNVHGIQVTGGSFPAEIWGKAMGRIHKGRKVGDWPAGTGSTKLTRGYPSWCNRAEFRVQQGPKNATCSSLFEDGITPGK